MPSIEFSMATNPRSTSPALDRVEHVGHRAAQHQLAARQVGLRLQRLLGERAERPEEADARGGSIHGRSGYGMRCGCGRVGASRASRGESGRVGAGTSGSGGAAPAAGSMAVWTSPTCAADRRIRSGATSADEAVAELRAAAVRRRRRRARRPPPRAAPGHARGDLRPRQDARAVRAHRRRAARPRQRTGAADPRHRSEQAKAVLAEHDGALVRSDTMLWRAAGRCGTRHSVLVVSAGTADVPVVDECVAHAARARVRRRPADRRRRRRAAPRCSRTSTGSPPPRRSSSSPAWRVRSPASSAG